MSVGTLFDILGVENPLTKQTSGKETETVREMRERREMRGHKRRFGERRKGKEDQWKESNDDNRGDTQLVNT